MRIADERLTLFVEALTLSAHIGVNHNERGRTQPLVFDVEMTIKPPITDDIDETFDYNLVISAVQRVLGGGHIELVEQVAARVGKELFEDVRVLDVRVRVAKPRAIAAAKAAGAQWSGIRRASIS